MNASMDTADNMAVLMINDNGIIHECNRAFEKLFGYLSSDILWKHVSLLLPQLAGIALMNSGQVNPRLRFLAHIGHQFEVISLGGIHFASQLFISEVENLGEHYLRIIICPS